MSPSPSPAARSSAIFQQLFLPVGLCLAILAAFIAPETGTLLNEAGLVIGLVPLIFLVNGFQTRLRSAPMHRRFGLTFLACACLGLILSPLLGVGAALLLQLPAAVALGLITMSAVPPTLSSGIIIADNAGGDRLWAVILTIGLNILGIFSVPFMLDLCLRLGEDIAIAPWPLLQRLVLVVLIPFLIGAALKKAPYAERVPGWIRHLPSLCIILTVWMSMAVSRETLLGLAPELFVLIVLGSLLVHGALLGLSQFMGRGLSLSPPESSAVMFVVSQKTLPVAIGVLTALSVPIAAALVVCIVFHFLQLIFDSFLAARIRATGASA